MSTQEMKYEVFHNKLKLNLISPMRIKIIEKYKEKQKNYMEYLEVTSCIKRWMLKKAVEIYLKCIFITIIAYFIDKELNKGVLNKAQLNNIQNNK